MTDYQIQPSTRRCDVTGRDLRPGESFFSVLTESEGKLVRRDVAADVWTGPPELAIAFWCGRVPEDNQPRKLRIDDDLLLDCFHRVEGRLEPGQVNFRYVLALLLMRRRRLKFEEASEDGEVERLKVRDVRTGSEFEIVHPRLTEAEMTAVQDEVFEVLGWD